MNMQVRVNTKWLAQRLGQPDISILDASWHLPATKRNAKAEFHAGHIPGAQFFDLDAASARDMPLPHMLPTPSHFAESVSDLGAGSEKTIVVYDAVGLFSAARCWWMFQHFGHEKVYVLDGGLPKWQSDGLPIEQESKPTRASTFVPSPARNRVATMNEVARSLDSATTQIADARSPSRFRGEEPEPRPGVKPGHMPGAFNVHYATLLRTDGTMKKEEELRTAITATGLDLKRSITTSCGSGVTAAILSLALAELGHTDNSLYDGSWAEWGASGNIVERLGALGAADVIMRKDQQALRQLANQ